MTTATCRSTEILSIAPPVGTLMGVTHPGYPDFLKALVKSIAKATKAGAKALLRAAASGMKWLKRKFDEGAEMHNRHMQVVDERYASNWYYMRSLM